MSRWFTKNPDRSIMGMMDPGALSTANCIVGATLDRRNDQLFVHTTVARHARYTRMKRAPLLPRVRPVTFPTMAR